MNHVPLGAAQQHHKAIHSCCLGSCSSFHLLLPGVQHNRKLKVLLLLSSLVQSESVLLGCHVEWGFSQTNHQSRSQLLAWPHHPLCWRVKYNYMLQSRVAGGGGEKHLFLIRCVVGFQCFERQIRLLPFELKEAIYVPCNCHIEVPQI